MQKFTIELSEDHLKIILTALSEVPYRHAAPVIAELQKQVEPQSQRGDQ